MKSENLITMSRTELNRQSVMQKIQDKQLSQVKAAEILNMSLRQVQRMWARYKAEGPEGLISRKRGKAPNNVIPEHIKQDVIAIIRENYPDFGPTLVVEKLIENHQIYYVKETIRKWMIEAQLWTPRN